MSASLPFSLLTPYSILLLWGSRGVILTVKWMRNHSPFLEGYYPHFLAFLHGHHEADRGKWQWSGLLRRSIKPQAGEIALTLQALQITTLSHLNATAISKETGCIFHHRRGARFRAKGHRAHLAWHFSWNGGCEVSSRNSFTAVGQAFIKA